MQAFSLQDCLSAQYTKFRFFKDLNFEPFKTFVNITFHVVFKKRVLVFGI